MIELADVSKHLPRTVSVSTLRHWWKFGIRGVRLETTKIGLTPRYTTKAALSEFFAARAKQDEHNTHTAQRDADTRSKLVQAGLL